MSIDNMKFKEKLHNEQENFNTDFCSIIVNIIN